MTWLLLVVLLLQTALVALAQDDYSIPSSIPSISISAIPSLLTLPPLNASNPLVELTIPALSSTYLTFNLCALPSGWNASSPGVPRILVSHDAEDGERDAVARWAFARAGQGARDMSSGGTKQGGANRRSTARDNAGEVWRLEWDKGFANWTYADRGAMSGVKVLIGMGLQTDGTVSPVEDQGNVVVHMGIAGTGPLHALDPKPPFVSDTTSDTALIFSPLLGNINQDLPQPTYPNYTIPAMPSTPPFNASAAGDLTGYNIIVVPTASSPTEQGLDNSICAARLGRNSTGDVLGSARTVMNRTEPIWTRIGPDGAGYRVAWGIGGLQSESNYTVWVEHEGVLSAPAWSSTKSASFSCSLLLPTDECPGISYAAPLTPTDGVPGNNSIVTSLLNTTTAILDDNLASFRTSLLSQACGRDVYSHVSTCLDCHEAYRDWLCRMLIPRCADPGASSNSSGITDDTGAPIAQAVIRRAPNAVSLSLSGLGLPQNVVEEGMAELAPCLSTCHAVERQCPAFLKFRCPHYSNGASRRYGFHGDRSASGNGDWGTGWPGVDRWGRAWCSL